MRGARRVSDDTSRSSPPSRKRARSRPMRRSRSRATARASGSRSMSSRRATGRCSCCGTRAYRMRKSPPRPDWRAARSGRRYRGRAGGWCKPTRRERQVSMSHVDDGTLHAYLDGELSPAEVQGVEAHLAQCPACRGRLDEERALITRAGELLALAAPPDRELPPFRAGHVKPPARAWWQVRQPLAWAATVVVALGIGTYLGRGVEQPRQPDTDAEPARPQALESPLSSERARREARVKLPGAAGTPRAAQPARPAPATPDRADYLAQRHDAPVAARAEASSVPSAPTPAPQTGVVSIDARRD